jgi:hypothetical protein
LPIATPQDDKSAALPLTVALKTTHHFQKHEFPARDKVVITPARSVTGENVERKISKTQKFDWPHKRNVRRSQFRSVGINKTNLTNLGAGDVAIYHHRETHAASAANDKMSAVGRRHSHCSVAR